MITEFLKAMNMKFRLFLMIPMEYFFKLRRWRMNFKQFGREWIALNNRNFCDNIEFDSIE